MSDRPFRDPQSEAMHNLTQNMMRAAGLPVPEQNPRPNEGERLEWPIEWGDPPRCYQGADGGITCILPAQYDFELLSALKILRIAWKAGDDATVKSCALDIHELLVRRKVDKEYFKRRIDTLNHENEKKERERKLREDPEYAAAFRAFAEAVNSGDVERVRSAQARLNQLGDQPIGPDPEQAAPTQ